VAWWLGKRSKFQKLAMSMAVLDGLAHGEVWGLGLGKGGGGGDKRGS
jgi:hypothetical protein